MLYSDSSQHLTFAESSLNNLIESSLSNLNYKAFMQIDV